MATDRDGLLNLYLKCFPEDSVPCAEFVFERLYHRAEIVKIKDGENTALFVRSDEFKKDSFDNDGGKLCAALYLLPKKMNFNNRNVTVPHIVGLGTDPEKRHLGYGKQLILKSFAACKDSPFITLYPFNHAFYEKFGFAAVSFDFEPPQCESEPADEKSLLRLYNEFCEGLDYYFERDENDFRFYCETLKLDNECYELVNGGLDGFVSSDEYIPRRFIQTQNKGVMARIVSLEKAMLLTGATFTTPLTVTDKFIAGNNRTFTLENGKIKPCENGELVIDISELTSAVFGKCERVHDLFPKKKGYLADRY